MRWIIVLAFVLSSSYALQAAADEEKMPAEQPIKYAYLERWLAEAIIAEDDELYTYYLLYTEVQQITWKRKTYSPVAFAKLFGKSEDFCERLQQLLKKRTSK